MKPSLLIAAAAATQVAATLALQLLVLAALGVGTATDIYVAGQAAPAVLLAVLGMSLQSVWQGRLAVAAANAPQWRLQHETAHGQALMAFAVFGFLGVLTSKWWVHALFVGMPAEHRAEVQRLTPPFMLATCIAGCSLLLTVAQRARDRSVSAEWIAATCAILAAAAAYPLVRTGGLDAAAWLLVGRAALGWALLQVVLRGSWPRLALAWRTREPWREMRPLALSASIYKSAPLVDRFWSAMAPGGGLTLYNLAQTAMGAAANVIERSICMPTTPAIARGVAAKDWVQVRSLYRSRLRRVSVVAACVLLAAAASWPLWQPLLGQALKMQAQQVLLLWQLCLLLAGFLHVAAAGTVVVAVFYALGDTRTPAMVGLFGFFVGVALKSLGFYAAGLLGLALATTVYYAVNLAALCWLVERRLARELSHDSP